MATSRPWRVTTPPPIKEVVLAEDHVNTKLDVPPILPPEQTGALVRAELEKRHFEEGEGGVMTRERGGVKVEVRPPTGEVTISVEASEEIEPPPSRPSPCGCRMRDALQEGIRQSSRERNDRQGRLQRAVTSRLEGSLPRLGCELEGVAARVTAEALKQKAAQMGEIKQITEDPQTGSLTIVVEV
jgi:hypothetical protein